MLVDLHNHTKRCNHANGECEEYVLAAIAQGVDIFGFSDHAPMKFDEAYRMGLDEVDDYRREVLDLRAKYRDKIDIRIGFEVDFISGMEYLIEPKVLNCEVDYLIGSVHFLDDWGFDNPAYIGEYAKRDMGEVWRAYLESIAQMAQSGLFEIVGHFDLLKVFNHKPPKSAEPHIFRALEAIKSSGMAIEINTAGLRKDIAEAYPSEDILRMCLRLGIPITFSSDAHALAQVGFGRDDAIQMAKRIGFKECVAFKNRTMEIFGF